MGCLRSTDKFIATHTYKAEAISRMGAHRDWRFREQEYLL